MSVRRQSFWDRRRLKIRESLAPLVCNIMRLAGGDWRLSVVPVEEALRAKARGGIAEIANGI